VATSVLLSGAVVGGIAYLAARSGALGPAAAKAAGDLRAKLAPILSKAGGKVVPCPTPEELAAKLGVTVYRVRIGLARSKKDGCSLRREDLAGIPELPGSVLVNGVPSVPNAQGAPATFSNPTGGSGTWGGLTDEQIRAAYVAANGGDAAKAAAAWAADHAREVAQRGF